MLAWARLSFAQNKSASSRRRVPQNTNLPSRSRLGERCSPERDAIPLRTTFDLAYARCPINHLKHPRILAWARYTRLSEMTCRPRPNYIAWVRYTSKIENTRPCMSRLGEPSSPERELQVWHWFTYIHIATKPNYPPKIYQSNLITLHHQNNILYTH